MHTEAWLLARDDFCSFDLPRVACTKARWGNRDLHGQEAGHGIATDADGTFALRANQTRAAWSHIASTRPDEDGAFLEQYFRVVDITQAVLGARPASCPSSPGEAW